MKTCRNHFLTKRSPVFTNRGIVEKRNASEKVYSETRIASGNGSPVPNGFNIGDKIYVAETNWGIYASGKIIEISDLFTATSVSEVIAYIEIEKKKDDVYWMDKIKRFHSRLKSDPGTTFKFQEYKIEQKLLRSPLPLVGELARLNKIQASIAKLKNDEVSFINNPDYGENRINLSPNIPNSLKIDIWGFFNTRQVVQHYIDIDHFVPKSTGGPGNIIENLVPVGLGLNRYKSNSIPKGFFIEVQKYASLSPLINNNFKASKDQFISGKQAVHDALRINKEVCSWSSIKDIRAFYRGVLSHHFVDYVRIIDEYANERGY